MTTTNDTANIHDKPKQDNHNEAIIVTANDKKDDDNNNNNKDDDDDSSPTAALAYHSHAYEAIPMPDEMEHITTATATAVGAVKNGNQASLSFWGFGKKTTTTTTTTVQPPPPQDKDTVPTEISTRSSRYRFWTSPRTLNKNKNQEKDVASSDTDDQPVVADSHNCNVENNNNNNNNTDDETTQVVTSDKKQSHATIRVKEDNNNNNNHRKDQSTNDETAADTTQSQTVVDDDDKDDKDPALSVTETSVKATRSIFGLFGSSSISISSSGKSTKKEENEKEEDCLSEHVIDKANQNNNNNNDNDNIRASPESTTTTTKTQSNEISLEKANTTTTTEDERDTLAKETGTRTTGRGLLGMFDRVNKDDKDHAKAVENDKAVDEKQSVLENTNDNEIQPDTNIASTDHTTSMAHPETLGVEVTNETNEKETSTIGPSLFTGMFGKGKKTDTTTQTDNDQREDVSSRDSLSQTNVNDNDGTPNDGTPNDGTNDDSTTKKESGKGILGMFTRAKCDKQLLVTGGNHDNSDEMPEKTDTDLSQDETPEEPRGHPADKDTGKEASTSIFNLFGKTKRPTGTGEENAENNSDSKAMDNDESEKNGAQTESRNEGTVNPDDKKMAVTDTKKESEMISNITTVSPDSEDSKPSKSNVSRGIFGMFSKTKGESGDNGTPVDNDDIVDDSVFGTNEDLIKQEEFISIGQNEGEESQSLENSQADSGTTVEEEAAAMSTSQEDYKVGQAKGTKKQSIFGFFGNSKTGDIQVDCDQIKETDGADSTDVAGENNVGGPTNEIPETEQSDRSSQADFGNEGDVDFSKPGTEDARKESTNKDAGRSLFGMFGRKTKIDFPEATNATDATTETKDVVVQSSEDATIINGVEEEEQEEKLEEKQEEEIQINENNSVDQDAKDLDLAENNEKYVTSSSGRSIFGMFGKKTAIVGPNIEKTLSEEQGGPSGDYMADDVALEKSTVEEAGTTSSELNENEATVEQKEKEEAMPTNRKRFWEGFVGYKMSKETDEKDDGAASQFDDADEDGGTHNADGGTEESAEVDSLNCSDDEKDEFADEKIWDSLSHWVESVKIRHEQLSEFELTRRKTFQTQWASVQAHAQVYNEIAEESLAEMQRLGDFVGGIWAAQRRFSEIMQEKKRQALLKMQSQTVAAMANSVGEKTSPLQGIIETNDPWNENKQLGMGLEPPSTADSAGNGVVESSNVSIQVEVVQRGVSGVDGRFVSNVTSSPFTPVLDELEKSQSLWESKFELNSGDTAKGIVLALETSWPSVIQEQTDQLVKVRNEIFPVVAEKEGAVLKAWDQYESAVNAATQTATMHQKRKNMRHVFSRVSVSPAEQQQALARDLADKPDVWMAERVYQETIEEMNRYWLKYILGEDVNEEDMGTEKDGLTAIATEKFPDRGCSEEAEPKEDMKLDSKQSDQTKIEDVTISIDSAETVEVDGTLAQAPSQDKDDDLAEDDVAKNAREDSKNSEEQQCSSTMENENASTVVPSEGTVVKEEKPALLVLPAAQSLLKQMAESEASLRVDVAAQLKDWLKGQEKLLQNSEAATSLAWIDWVGPKEADNGKADAKECEAGIDGDVEATVEADGTSVPSDGNKEDASPDQESIDSEEPAVDEKDDEKYPGDDDHVDEDDEAQKVVPANTMTEAQLQERRAQLQDQVEKTLAEKWSMDEAHEWLQANAHAEETYQVMHEVFGIDAYLESPHVVSAAVGEWWKIDRNGDVKTTTTGESANARDGNKKDTTGDVTGVVAADNQKNSDKTEGAQINKDRTESQSESEDRVESERRVALVIISSGPQMHIYNLSTNAVVLDLETPPQDALWELLSSQSFPIPTVSIPLADAQVRLTDEVDTMEVIPASTDLPCIRMLCPHLNNIY